MKNLLIIVFISLQVLLIGCAQPGNWPNEENRNRIEYYWYERQLLGSKEEAVGTIKNLSPYFRPFEKALNITSINVDDYGLRASGTWIETREEWVNTSGGMFVGFNYVPTYGGFVQRSSNNRDGAFSVPFKDVDAIWLVRYTAFGDSYPWGVGVSYTGKIPPVDLRVRSKGEALQLISAIETMAAALGYKYSTPGFAIRELTYEQSSELDLPNGTGAYCSIVCIGGPFEKAGLRTGDIILTIDGKEQRGLSNIRSMLGGTKEWVLLRRSPPWGSFEKISLMINADEIILPMMQLNGYLSE